MESGSSKLLQRVEEELEDLNQASEDVNKLEVLLEEVKKNFHKALQSAAYTKKSLKKRLGSCVEKARPYYEAKMREQALLEEKKDAAKLLARAKSLVDTGRKEVDQIEREILEETKSLTPELQVKLNEATIKLDDSIKELHECKERWEDLEKKCDEINQSLSKLHHEQKNSIKKATEYFECCDDLDCTLGCWKTKIDSLQANINEAKERYRTAMKNLEHLSNSVHQRRKSESKEVGYDDGGSSLGYEEIDAKLHPTRLELAYNPCEAAAEDRYPSLQRDYRGQSIILYANYNIPEKTPLCSEEEGDSNLRSDLQVILDRFLTLDELENLGLDLEVSHDLEVTGVHGKEKQGQ